VLSAAAAIAVVAQRRDVRRQRVYDCATVTHGRGSVQKTTGQATGQQAMITDGRTDGHLCSGCLLFTTRCIAERGIAKAS